MRSGINFSLGPGGRKKFLFCFGRIWPLEKKTPWEAFFFLLASVSSLVGLLLRPMPGKTDYWFFLAWDPPRAFGAKGFFMNVFFLLARRPRRWGGSRPRRPGGKLFKKGKKKTKQRVGTPRKPGWPRQFFPGPTGFFTPGSPHNDQ